MKDIIINNRTLILLSSLWVMTASFNPTAAIVLIVVSAVLMMIRRMRYELFMGFWLILILSDNYDYAGDVKNVYIVIVSLYLFMEKDRKLPFDNTIFLFIPFFLVSLIGLFFTPVMSSSVQKLLSYFLIILVATNYVRELYISRGNQFLKELIYFSCAIALFGVIYSRYNPSQVEQFSSRTAGLFRNPNGFGIFMSLVVMLFAFLKQYNPNLFNRRESIIFYAIAGMVLYMCGSRTAVTAIIILFIFNTFFSFSPIIGFIVFVFTVLSYQLIISNVDRVVIALGLENFFRIGSIDTGSGRIIAWNFAWSEIQYDFYFGNGFSYTEYLFKKYEYELSLLGHQGNAHNSYLTFWLDTGIFGLVAYLRGFIVTFLRGAKKVPVAFPILFGVMFSIFYESWLTASLNPYTIILFMMAGLFNTEPVIDDNEIREQIENEKDPIPVY